MSRPTTICITHRSEDGQIVEAVEIPFPSQKVGTEPAVEGGMDRLVDQTAKLLRAFPSASRIPLLGELIHRLVEQVPQELKNSC